MEGSYMEGLEFSLRKAGPSSMLLFPMSPLKSILLRRYGFFIFNIWVFSIMTCDVARSKLFDRISAVVRV